MSESLLLLELWSARRNSNPQHPAWRAGALPFELLAHEMKVFVLHNLNDGLTEIAGLVRWKGLEPLTF